MDDLGTAIQSFLSQPGAMEQVEAMAKQLGLGNPEPEASSEETASTAQMEPLEAITSGLGGLSPESLGKLLGALRDGGASQSAALLEALRPLLRLEKQEKLDRAIRAVRLMGAARTVSKTIEL